MTEAKVAAPPPAKLSVFDMCKATYRQRALDDPICAAMGMNILLGNAKRVFSLADVRQLEALYNELLDSRQYADAKEKDFASFRFAASLADKDRDVEFKRNDAPRLLEAMNDAAKGYTARIEALKLNLNERFKPMQRQDYVRTCNCIGSKMRFWALTLAFATAASPSSQHLVVTLRAADKIKWQSHSALAFSFKSGQYMLRATGEDTDNDEVKMTVAEGIKLSADQEHWYRADMRDRLIVGDYAGQVERVLWMSEDRTQMTVRIPVNPAPINLVQSIGDMEYNHFAQLPMLSHIVAYNSAMTQALIDKVKYGSVGTAKAKTVSERRALAWRCRPLDGEESDACLAALLDVDVLSAVAC